MLRPGPVTFERTPDGVGVPTARPRISWRLPLGSGDQYAYELELRWPDQSTVVSRVESGDRYLVPWPARDLASRERVAVRVRVWTVGSDEPQPWSEPAFVEAALLRPEDWVAKPVGGAWPEDPDTERRPARVRREFTVDRPIVSARLYASAHGVYEAEINGVRVGDDVLSPGWTVYGKRLRYRAYDVTGLVRPGRNAIGAWLGDGWYRGRLGFHGGTRDIYGHDQSFIGQLEIRHDDGSLTTVATDSSWSAGFGPILASSLYDGESFDGREHDPGWSCPDAAGVWSPVAVNDRDPGTLFAADGPAVRATEALEPVGIERRPDGSYLLDFGQNLVGRLAITVDGPRGTRVVLRHAEVTVDDDLAIGPLRQARATDEYVLAGGGPETWEPRFTLHGFRYAELSGWPGELSAGAVVARVYHTDMPLAGTFTCSDPLVQRLHDNVRWSMRGNFVDIPTDCPARDERLGWTGDVQIFAPTAVFLYDCLPLLDSWLVDVGLEQQPDGIVPWYVPVIPGTPMWTPPRPGAGWGDVVALTPIALYQSSGDLELLRRHYGPARAWVDLVDSLAGPDHIWDNGFQLGDWLDPVAPPDDPAAAATDPHLIATAYFAWSARHVALAAAALDRPDEAARYAGLADAVADAFRDRYLTAEGRLTSDHPTAYAMAVVFGLAGDGVTTRLAGDRLATLVAENDFRIATGFLGTPLVCDALTTTGHVEVAYRLLMQTQCPSWLYPVTQGATTIWERWDSLRPDGTLNSGGMTSFNHFALGSVADWLHRVVAGIAAAAPGYRRIAFHPRPGGGLTSAAASHETPHGRASIAWDLVGDEMVVEMTVPPNCTATARLSVGTPVELTSGTHRFVVPRPGLPAARQPADVESSV